MAELVQTTSEEFYGPFLLDYDKLVSLDKIIDNIWEKLKVYRKEIIDQRIDEELKHFPTDTWNNKREAIENSVNNDYYINKFHRKITFFLASGKKLIASSFKEAAMDENLEKEKIEKFLVEIECVNIEATIGNKNSPTFNFLCCYVNTFSNPLSQEIYFEFKRWIKQVRSNILVKLWRIIGRFFLPFIFLLILIIPIKSDNNKDILKQQAIEILKDGIKDNEIEKAVELLLYHEFDLTQNKSSIVWDNKKVLLLAFISIPFLILFFPPYTILGIGKRERELKLWLGWIKFVTYVLPVLIVLPFLINFLSSKI